MLRWIIQFYKAKKEKMTKTTIIILEGQLILSEATGILGFILLQW